MKKTLLLLISLFATSALASTLEQEYFNRNEKRLERLDESGLTLKKACLEQILTKLNLKDKVAKIEDLDSDFGYGLQLKNGDVCLVTMNLRNLSTTTSCNSQAGYRTVQSDLICQEK